MKNVKRALALLLCLVMVLSYVPTYIYAAEGEPNVTMTVDKTEVNVGDTVIVTIKTNAMEVTSFACALKFDANLLTVAELNAPTLRYEMWDEDEEDYIQVPLEPTAFSTVDEANASGTVGAAWANATERSYSKRNTLIKITFTAKNSGTVILTLSEDSAGTNGCKNENVETKTVTIKGASEPECQHPTTKLVSNNDGTHNVVCANADCGEVITSNVPCAGNDDGNCTTAVSCECGYVITAAKPAHVDGDDKNHDCDYCDVKNIEGHTEATRTEPVTEADCENAATFRDITYCTECDETLHTGNPYPSGNPLGHSWGTTTYTWTDDGKTCTATHVCTKNAEHKETETVTATGAQTKDPTCTEKGTTTYTATFNAEWATTQTKDVQDIPATNHDWTVSYAWTQTVEGWDCTATRICDNDAAHKETVTVSASSTVTTVGTCETEEVVTYRVDFAESWADDQTKVVTGVKNPNNHVGGVSYVYENTTKTHHDKVTVCSGCSARIGKVTEPHDYTHDAANHKCVCDVRERFEIIMNANGGKFSDDAPVYAINSQYGDRFTAIPANPTREGYTFTGWNTKADGTGVSFDPTKYTFTENVTIYAQWEQNHVCAHDHYDITETTHQSICSCGTPIGAAQPHDYTSGAAAYTCICGAKFTGWDTITDDGGVDYTRYILDGNVLYGWNEVEDAWYYFHSTTGARVTGLNRVPYPTDTINGIKYEADADAKAYYEAKGKTFIDAAEAWFYFGDDGKFAFDSNGFVSRDNGQGKLVNGMLAWHPGLIRVADGEYAYFIGDEVNGGNIGANGDTYITKNNGIEDFKVGDVYNFTNAKLSGLNGIKDGKYYENSRLMKNNGLTEVTVDGETKYIYVKSTGYLATGEYYVTNVTNDFGTGIKKGDKVRFDENGFLVEVKNGIIDGKYYVGGHVAYNAGIVEIAEGQFIYVRSNGEVVMNCDYWVTNVGDSGLAAKKYTFDANGILQSPVFVEEACIVDGYYYVNGKIAYAAGLVAYNDGLIYVRSNGQVATGKYWVTNTNGLKPAGFYTFGDDGMMIE